MLIKRLANYILDLFLPAQCVLTGKIVMGALGLSKDIFSSIHFISEPRCKKCAAPLKFSLEACKGCVDDQFYFHSACSVFEYNEDSKALLLQYKHGDRLNLTPLFSKWMYSSGREMLLDADIVIPVPLHTSRLRKRMYNQAAELVKGIAKITPIYFVLNGLIRVRSTPSQESLNKSRRVQNMKGAFLLTPSFLPEIKGKSILIVDDVMTTGATLNACAKVLLEHGAKKVLVLTLSKALLS